MRAGREADWMAISGISVQKLYHFPIIFLKGDCVVYLDEPGRLKERGETIELEFRESMVHRLERDTCCRDRQSFSIPQDRFSEGFRGRTALCSQGWIRSCRE